MIIPSALAGGFLFLKPKIILEKSKISIDNSEMAWYNVITTREQQTGSKKMTARPGGYEGTGGKQNES